MCNPNRQGGTAVVLALVAKISQPESETQSIPRNSSPSNPKHQTMSPQPQPSIPTPTPYILNPGPRNPNPESQTHAPVERQFLIDHPLVRIHLFIVMIRWTGLAPWAFEFSFPGSLTSTFLYRLLLGVQHVSKRLQADAVYFEADEKNPVPERERDLY